MRCRGLPSHHACKTSLSVAGHACHSSKVAIGAQQLQHTRPHEPSCQQQRAAVGHLSEPVHSRGLPGDTYDSSTHVTGAAARVWPDSHASSADLSPTGSLQPACQVGGTPVGMQQLHHTRPQEGSRQPQRAAARLSVLLVEAT